jgi:hypothetical protein
MIMRNGCAVVGFGDADISVANPIINRPLVGFLVGVTGGAILGSLTKKTVWIAAGAIAGGIGGAVGGAAWAVHQIRVAAAAKPPPSKPEMVTPELQPAPESAGSGLVGPQYLTKYTTTALQLIALPDPANPVMLCSYAAYYAADAKDLGSSNAQLTRFRTKYETPVEDLYGIKGRRWIVLQRKRFFDPKTFQELPSDTLFESSNKFPVPTSPDAGVPCG